MSAVMMVCQALPLHILSEANSRQHWRQAAARKKLHRQTAQALLNRHERPRHDGPITITLTRIAPRTLDDDNLASGFKACRDGVADWLGIDDGDKRLTWRYAQSKRAAKWYAAECLVEWQP
jgi:hypothetical protein